MKNFTSTLNHENNLETMTQYGFENALVVEVDEHWSHDDLNGTWGTICQSVVPDEDVKVAFKMCIEGKVDSSLDALDATWLLHKSYYWLVRRGNGKLYPFPLLFEGQKEREESAYKYNGWKWSAFYEGRIDSRTLEKGLVDVPSEEEIRDLLRLVEHSIAHGETPWDHLDQRGGLVPRWAA